MQPPKHQYAKQSIRLLEPSSQRPLLTNDPKSALNSIGGQSALRPGFFSHCPRASISTIYGHYCAAFSDQQVVWSSLNNITALCCVIIGGEGCFTRHHSPNKSHSCFCSKVDTALTPALYPGHPLRARIKCQQSPA